MRRLPIALVAAGAIALLVAPAALSHVGIEPASIQPDEAARLTFYAPNEGHAAIVELQVIVPSDAKLAVAQAVPGWQATVRGQTVTWRGGRIPVGQYGLFSVI